MSDTENVPQCTIEYTVPQRTVMRALRTATDAGQDAEEALTIICETLTNALTGLSLVGIGDTNVLRRQKAAADVMLAQLRRGKRVAEEAELAAGLRVK